MKLSLTCLLTSAVALRPYLCPCDHIGDVIDPASEKQEESYDDLDITYRDGSPRERGGVNREELVPIDTPRIPARPVIFLGYMHRNQFAHKQHPVTRADGSIHLIAFGDWGNPKGLSLILMIADYIRTRENLNLLDAVMLLGDNFYPTGVSGPDDPLWTLFTCALAARTSKPFYSIVGNHDMWSNPDAQKTYHHPQWRSDLENFFVQYVSHQIITCVWYMHYGMTGSPWIAALEESLGVHAAHCKWRIIASHVPVITAGAYRDNDEVRILNHQIRPLIEKFNIHMYISGHEHNSQVLSYDRTNCRYVIAGGTAVPRAQDINPSAPNLLWMDTQHYPTVVDIEATEHFLSYRFVDVSDDKIRIPYWERIYDTKPTKTEILVN